MNRDRVGFVILTAIENGSRDVEAGNEQMAVKKWLEGWHAARLVAKDNHYRSIDELEGIAVGRPLAFMSNWLLDLESCLGNLAMHSTHWAKQRLDFVREVLDLLSNSPKDVLFTLRHAEAETLFLLDKRAEGDEYFERLCKDYPSDAWAYIGWGDMYSPKFYGNRWTKMPEKAREIYERGLAECSEDKDELTRRISLLSE